MRSTFSRVSGIVKADFLIRFRRSSTLVIFLFLCIAAYLWIPDPATGKALIQIDGRRALYNSAALAVGSGAIFTLLIGLIGYYMISSAVRRDVETRTGFIIASTGVRNAEYLAGKFLGNAVFLTAVAAAFMISSMIMQLVRGEAALNPLIFIAHYFALVPPMIVFVSVLALVFESVPLLSGRFGDFVYFFFWVASIGIIAADSEKNPTWSLYFDSMGFAFLLDNFRTVMHTTSLSLGHSSFDITKPPFVFNGFGFSSAYLLPRLTSLLYPVPLMVIPLLFFRRFDPARLKMSAHKSKRNLLAWANHLLKPLAVFAMRPLSGRPNPLFAETLLIFQLYPLVIVLWTASIVVTLFAPLSSLRTGILPAIFAVLTIFLADGATREKRFGTGGFIFSAPRLQPNYIWWKFASALLFVFFFTLLPLIRIVIADPVSAFSLLIGSILFAASSTALGSATGNPKTFIVVFLLFWYVVLNDGGRTPSFDFAGWFGSATMAVRFAYAGIATLLLAGSEAFYRFQESRL